MSEHVRTCEACKHFLPCEVAEKIVEGYPAEMLIDAMPSMAVKRMRPKEYRHYHRLYMQKVRKLTPNKWRQKKGR